MSSALNKSLAPASNEAYKVQSAKNVVDNEWAAEPTGLRAFVDFTLVPGLLVFGGPSFCLLLAFITTLDTPSVSSFGELCMRDGWGCAQQAFVTTMPTVPAATILLVFNLIALVVYHFPGPTAYGPITANGAKPAYVDNGIAHFLLSTGIFLGGSDLGIGLWKLSIFFEHFAAMAGTLNLFGLLFCAGLYVKGFVAPSGPDCGSSGRGILFDYYWGMELYPRIFGVDVKKFVNCRFSMTFWMLAGISFTAASYEKHNKIDPGLMLCALSTFIYLFKFYIWEIGYMRSIDIIVDRAGFYETWGCLLWVPCLYTLHTRVAVNTPSGLSWPIALTIFIISLCGVLLNFWADDQRQRFREQKGDCEVWGKEPVYIEAKYHALNVKTGEYEEHTSLLLASGWWGAARHFQYFFELVAAWSWGLLGGVGTHGLLPLFYPIFLTILLIHRASRDEEKCLAKYGKHYEEYMDLVPYKIVPLVY
eukprot:TRINITY_DN7139_c0_g2_i1.p1 TRINITY_DN7139_c0_g2~~TRINITY_DN7139_c0_g2_i1.p1  ORF type:complete len:494 (+),score=93.85 TRINITY_DN7139_c0_g2_i1:59-1483(+)